MIKVKDLKKKIKQLQKKVISLGKKEKKARDRWNKAHNKFIKSTGDLVTIKRHGTKKESKLKDIILSWPEKSIFLTSKRDQIRNDISDIKKQIDNLKNKLSELVKDIESQSKEIDEKVNQVFAANKIVISAIEARDSFLENHVYNKLVDENGKIKSQVTLLSSDGKRKVVVLTNTIVIINPDLAILAQKKIENFFSTFKEKIESEMDSETKLLYKIVSELLIEKKSFKPGQYLYQFLNINIGQESYPELYEAQTLLKQSLGSKKSGTYIKLYERFGIKNSFKPLRTK